MHSKYIFTSDSYSRHKIKKMDDLEAVPVLVLVISAAYRQILRNRRRRRQFWVRPWIQRREQHGAHHTLMIELAREDHESYKNFLRMNKGKFEELLHKVSPLIQRQDTNMRECISPAERLSFTLRYLATGDSYRSFSYLYRVPVSTLSKIIPETCSAIYRCLKTEYLKVPDTEEEWNAIIREFQHKWNFPNCIGAMDGKHIAIRCPQNSGSNYYNYKQFYSIVLFALVDADYKFIYVDCGCNGRVSDGGVFANSNLFAALEQNSLHIPEGKTLPQRQVKVPNVIVGDEAFPLKSYIMKPYPSRNLDQTKRIFNYRLSRARRIVENVFGILTCRFGVIKNIIPLEPEKVEQVVLACCALHNFLRTDTSSSNYIPQGMLDEEDTENGNIIPGSWRQEVNTNLHGLSQQCGNRSCDNVREIRDEFCDYFNTNGQVPWQWEMI